MSKQIVYPVLAAEMKTRRIKKNQIAQVAGIGDKTLYNKLHGSASFTWEEVLVIRDKLFPGIPLEELFTRPKQNGG